MKKHLILITAQFPFGKGETFLESEIEYLDGFDSVIIFPLEVEDYSNMRSIGKCEVRKDALGSNQSVLKKVARYGLSTLCNKSFLKEVSILFRTRKFSIENIVRLFSFWSSSKYVESKISSALIDLNVSKDDKILFYSYWSSFGALSSINLSKKFKKGSAVSRCHGYDFEEERYSKNYLPFRNEIYSGLDGIFPIADNTKNYLLNRYPFLKYKLFVRNLGTVDHKVKSVVRKRSLRVVSCSNVIPLKRVERIYESLLLISGSKIEWTHYGDGQLMSSLKEKVSKSPSRDIKVNFQGHIDNEKILSEYMEKPFDVFINVSETEGKPVSIMEAMSFGTPIIATNVGGTSEMIEEGVSGFLLEKNFENKDLASLLQKFIYMSDEEYEQIRKSARNSWENTHNASKNYLEFNKDLLSYIE